MLRVFVEVQDWWLFDGGVGLLKSLDIQINTETEVFPVFHWYVFLIFLGSSYTCVRRCSFGCLRIEVGWVVLWWNLDFGDFDLSKGILGGFKDFVCDQP